MKNFPRMYIISSNVLPKGKAAAQSCHALAAHQQTHPEKFETWDNYYLVCLRGNPKEIVDKVFFMALDESKKSNPDRFSLPSMGQYNEPDMDNALTAVAVLALNEKQLEICDQLFKDLPLL